MKEESQTYSLIKWGVVAIDLVVMNFLLTIFLFVLSRFFLRGIDHNYHLIYFVFNVVYLLCVSLKGPILQMRNVRSEQIVGRVFATMVWFSVLSFLSINYIEPYIFPWKLALCFYICLFISISISRLCSRAYIRWVRGQGRNKRDVIFVGSYSIMADLYDEMMGDPTTGYKILGYFDDKENENFRVSIPYLGMVSQLESYMEENNFHPMGRVYCCLPSARGSEIRKIVVYCDNH